MIKLFEKHVLIFIKILEFSCLKSVNYHLNQSSTIMLAKVDVNQIFLVIGKQVVSQQINTLSIWNHTLFMDNSAILVYKIQHIGQRL